MVIESIASDPRLSDLLARLSASGGVVHAAGLWGSAARLVTAHVACAASCVHVFITAHFEQADHARIDLELFLGSPVELFPAWETLPGEGAASGEIDAERLRLCGLLSSEEAKPTIIVAPIQALMQPVPSAEVLAANTLHLRAGFALTTPGVHSPDELVGWAVDRDYERLERVESIGDVARRGDIVDLFVLGENAPFRVQFDGEVVESIRRFDVSSQRSMDALASVSIRAVGCAAPSSGQARPQDPPVSPLVKEGSVRPRGLKPAARGNPLASSLGEGRGDGSTNFLSYLPTAAVVVLENPGEIAEMARVLESRIGVSERFFKSAAVFGGFERFTQLHLSEFAPAAVSGEPVFDLGVTSLTRFEGAAGDSASELARLARDHEVHVVCDNQGERDRLIDLLREVDPAAARVIRFSIGVLQRGFVWTATRTAVVAHHELFHRQRPARKIRRVEAGRTLESWTDLKPGEFVVHVLHGIAAYRGLHKMRKGDSEQQEEFLTLEFAEGGVVHVPTSQIDLVQKYIGSGGRKPQLSTLGGKRWGKTKEKVAESVSELAETLLRLQARRGEAVGTAYPGDTNWQREFEAAFLYEETEDQLIVADEIRADLCRPRPMDRLLCGDVGYGKTELAMRAAFKVVEYGRQVAVLVPTTVLAEQHYETFRERMADYPFSIGCLSRFRTPVEQKVIVDKARRGQVDIVVGTHRLLSKDVSFANLGLVVIDEEQRFGVEHKERLRAMRETVDVLTLTATPIPRTLHMSLMGIRDISSLQTPPVDRRSIATHVRPFERGLIREAVLREMNRDGQVYFVHNFVQSIAAMADTVRAIVPEARVLYGHGQMGDHELEEVMHKFVRREADVLVATTIIESGIDIPSANTIFINRADRFGLADLHQLRGRVGRSNHRAYCYLLLSPDRPMTSKAAKRLKTIEEFSELGAGFRIAMRDLEIRGAGNLLGAEQSGHIAAVGYEMYCRLLEQTVRRLKNEPDPTPPAVHVDLDVAAHVPSHYIASERSRIEVYRRIVTCSTPADLTQLERDLVDAYGAFPREVQRLLELAEIRVLARSFGIQAVTLRPPDVVFTVEHVQAAQVAFEDAPGTVRAPDAKTIHLRLPPAYLEPGTLVSVLRNLLAKAVMKARTLQGAR